MNRIFHFALALGFLSLQVPAQTNGIFADFSTSMGDFTLFLDHERAPMAVASFVGLATGEGSWADNGGNVWMDRPFYDGSIFHRVVPAPRNAIQGGGTYGDITFTALFDGPAETDGSAGYFVTTNPPGVTTNNFLGGDIPFTTLNAAAIATNYTYDLVTVQTNAPAVTRTVIQLLAWSSNATTYVADSYRDESWYTNHTLQEVETTNFATIFTVTTNLSGSPEEMFHYVSLGMASTNFVWLPVVNFVNAGYYMLDLATNGLLHSNGVISMANSGPNTDGSQFFITATNVSAWDGSYTVFGHVTTGMTVVTSIAAVAVSGIGARPVVDVVLSNVVIRRVGADAEAFNIASQGLPVVESGEIGVLATGALAQIQVELPPYTETLFRVSTNGLKTWDVEDWGYHTNSTFEIREVVTNMERMAFFHASCVRYQDAWTSPTSHLGHIFTFQWESGTNPITWYEAHFSANTNSPSSWYKTQGTNEASGQIFGFPYPPRWTDFPYSAKLYFADNLGEYSYSLWFNPGKVTNRFTGIWSEWGGAQHSLLGVFTVTGP